jgi:RNA polymerase sigma-70 factor, ECF subfamily
VERAAFDEFYAGDYPRLVAAIGLLIGDAEIARDAVDEALARAWERAHRGHHIDSLGAWTRVVAMNVARGRFRRLRTERRAYALNIVEETMTSTDAAAAVDVRQALHSLPTRQREVVVMHYFLDLTVAEIAAELRINDGTVKSCLFRARATLAAVLSDRPAADDTEVARAV